MGKRAMVLASAAALLIAQAATAQERPSALLGKVIECKSIADPGKRLSCYDTQVDALDAASKRREVVVVDREQMKETRKSLFGFTLPKIGLFGGEDKEELEGVDEIESTIASVRTIGNERWSIVLTKDAGTWETMSPTRFDPKAGQEIHISKAAMGSYLGRFGSNRGIRFRRVK